jgi:hypothetical protein
MGVRNPSVYVKAPSVGSVVVTVAGEFIMCTLPPLNIPFAGAAIFIQWYANIQAATGTGFSNYHIRRGTTLAGAAVGFGIGIPTPAVQLANFTQVAIDVPGDVAEQQYVITLTPDVITSGNYTVEDFGAIAYVL